MREVAVDAYLLAKHELTLGQWQRLAHGDNPSYFQPASDARVTLAHPVEHVSWLVAHEILRQQGLTLPTETQWEYTRVAPAPRHRTRPASRRSR